MHGSSLSKLDQRSSKRRADVVQQTFVGSIRIQRVKFGGSVTAVGVERGGADVAAGGKRLDQLHSAGVLRLVREMRCKDDARAQLRIRGEKDVVVGGVKLRVVFFEVVEKNHVVPVGASSATTIVTSLAITAGVTIVVGVAASPLKMNVVAHFCHDMGGNKIILDRRIPAEGGITRNNSGKKGVRTSGRCCRVCRGR
jgi:hypothetical protein